MNAIPIFEAKNRLPFFIHQAESSGPVFISRRNKDVAVLISIENYNSLIAKTQKRKPTILEKAAELRKHIDGLISDEEIDRIFSSARDEPPDTYESHLFDDF